MRALAWVLAASIGGTTVVACFSERGSGPGNITGECRVPVSVISSGQFVVAMKNVAFQPDSLKVPVGATVTWVNCEDAGQEPHTTTSATAVWSSPVMTTGDRYSHTFAGPGTFAYSCTIHPGMIAKIVVQ